MSKNGGIEAQKEAIKKTLIGIAKTHNKFYCYASRETLCLLLSRYHAVNVSVRTMTRRLHELQAEGYTVIQHRNWSEVNGSKKFRCNLYYLTKKLLLWVKKLGEYARKVFSHFREPTLAHYSYKPLRRDLEKASGNVEILWKSALGGGASPVKGIL
jgi:hypothetical protein